MIITKITNNAMCNKGTIARNMEFKTTCKPAKREGENNRVINEIVVGVAVAVYLVVQV